MNRTLSENLQKSKFSYAVSGTEVHTALSPEFSMEELIRMSMATMIFLSDFMAERMFAPFSQVRSSGLVIPNL